jgi:cathepsin B
MKYVVAFALLALFALAFAQEQAYDALNSIIEEVNSNPSATWSAGHNKFSSMSWTDIKRMLLNKPEPSSVRLSDDEIAMWQSYEATRNAPDNWDARKAFPACAKPVRDQGKCGSCWAVSGAETLTDTMCVATNGSFTSTLSPQDLVSCDWTNMGCNGGILPLAWFYLKHTGIVTEECLPYVSGTGNVPKCPSQCNTGGEFKANKHKATNYHHLGQYYFFQRPAKIQEHLMQYGAVQTGFSVYQDFLSYKSGVYKHVTGSFLGGHAVKIIGWGVDSLQSPPQPYWIVQNSWGTNWGLGGFFWIARGTNECGFEADAYGGTYSA